MDKVHKNDGSWNLKSLSSDQATGSSSSPEGNGSLESSILPSRSDKKPLITFPLLSSQTFKMDHRSSSTSNFTPSERTSIKFHHSPGNKLFKQTFHNRIPSLKSGILLEALKPFEHGNDFSEISKFPSSSPDSQFCSVCWKVLKDKSSYSLPDVAVLVCGHVFHAECLESSTPETEKYDPPCPVCMINHGKIIVSDVNYVEADSASNRGKRTGKVKSPNFRTSSSMKNSFHHGIKRKGFRTRYSRK